RHDDGRRASPDPARQRAHPRPLARSRHRRRPSHRRWRDPRGQRGIGAAGVPEATEVIDCKGKLVAPGLVDMRAFVGEPGAEYRETIASASQAAAAGGVTTIVSQPDTSPAIDDPAIVDFVLRRARDTSIVHVQPMAALTKGLRGEEMAEI